jgi:CBS domain-containing protein
LPVQISEVMTRDVEIARPDDTIRTAAKMMADLGVGVLPVGEGDRLAGMITDRDVTVRAVACGLDPDRATLREVMTAEVRYCFEDEAIEEAARRMGEAGVRRLPVLNRAKRLVGIVSLGDVSIADRSGAGGAAGALRNVSRAPADERQGALALAGGKPRATMPEGDARGGSGIDPDDLMKGGF